MYSAVNLRKKFYVTLFKHAYLRADGDHLDITPADAMLVYLNVYNQDRLLDTPTDIAVNRLC